MAAIVKRTYIHTYFNGLVLPHLDYADVVWGDQPGLTTQMKQLQSFQNRIAKKISKEKMTSADALTTLQWVPLHARRFGHRCCLVQDAIKGKIPEHFDCIFLTFNVCLEPLFSEDPPENDLYIIHKTAHRDPSEGDISDHAFLFTIWK
ncbi:hypothetical protein P5673_021147 [Acropora cervicornis]|uniref:Uncharacterized protein n=1 Tax=Acropora cervicornis TaxID=6130 RepID=A0AAD9Q8Z4_ACRCE|nr:hypothetical protein P5673_021147 [Acropora cervicornis]